MVRDFTQRPPSMLTYRIQVDPAPPQLFPLTLPEQAWIPAQSRLRGARGVCRTSERHSARGNRPPL